MRWMQGAACAVRPGSAWVQESSGVPTVVLDEMRSVCFSCSVLESWRSYAAAEDISGGFWAGEDRGLGTEEEAPAWADQEPLPGLEERGEAG